MISFVLSGGSGTRLWPLSRQSLPKQFSPLFDESLLAMTVRRLQEFGEVGICTGENLRGLTQKNLRDNKLQVRHCLFEPQAKNTAPAVALICKTLLLQGKGHEVVGIFPADHWIGKPKTFGQALAMAQDSAAQGAIVTLGIEPHYPATGFGYIEVGEGSLGQSMGPLSARSVLAFREKPEKETAETYLKSGKHFWNSGMFVFSVETMVQSFKKFMPQTWSLIDQIHPDLSNLKNIYGQLEGLSLDYGIMEHATNQVCIPCDLGWSDLGSWDDIQGFGEGISSKNNQAEVISHEASDNFAYALDKQKVCFLGVQGVQLVSTPDVLYVGKKGRSQEMKALLNKVKASDPKLASDHVFENRPWGSYRSLHEATKFKVKVISVDSHQQLSYQSHEKRSEIWIVVEGVGEVVLNDEVRQVSAGSIVEIPARAKHRMRNTGDEPLRFVEVQTGTYFGEEDIVRYQDDYNRLP